MTTTIKRLNLRHTITAAPLRQLGLLPAYLPHIAGRALDALPAWLSLRHDMMVIIPNAEIPDYLDHAPVSCVPWTDRDCSCASSGMTRLLILQQR